MRLLTDEQHAQIVELLETLSIYVTASTHPRGQLWREDMRDVTEALATLQALPEVEHVGWYDTFDNADLTYSVGELMGGNTDGLKPLYATKEPS